MFFDPIFYSNIYPDLKSMTESELQIHYRDTGIAEGRVGSEHQLKQFIANLPYEFDYQYYQKYPDVPRDLIGSMVHFYMHGNKEGRVYNSEQIHVNNSNLEEIIKQEEILDEYINIDTEQDKRINILVRTHNREVMFLECMNSILKQSYTNYTVYISAQTKEDYAYVAKYIKDNNLHKQFNVIMGISTPGQYHYNNFCNQLIYLVNEGWILFLDDDDQFTTRHALRCIAQNIDESTMVLWKYKRPDKLIFPELNDRLTQPGTIASTSYCIYHNVAKQSAWPMRRAGDFYYIEPIYNNIKKTMIDRILVKYQLSSQTASYGESVV